MLTLTSFAVSKAKEFLAEQDEHESFRVRVQPGGCSGFEYDIVFDKKKEDDEVLYFDGLDVVIDPMSKIYLQGAEIDFVETSLQAGFVVNNDANEKGKCGCGTSFSV